MNTTKKVLTYLLIAIVAVVCLIVVWHYFQNQIILALGWVALFILVFGAGWVVGRLSARKTAKVESDKPVQVDGE
jgi:Flp pilus assembly protein TadB